MAAILCRFESNPSVLNRKAGKDGKGEAFLPALSALPVQRFFPGCCLRRSFSRLRVRPGLQSFHRDLHVCDQQTPPRPQEAMSRRGVLKIRPLANLISGSSQPVSSGICFVSFVCFVGPLGPVPFPVLHSLVIDLAPCPTLKSQICPSQSRVGYHHFRTLGTRRPRRVDWVPS